MSSSVPGPTWHVQVYFPRLSAETTTSRFEWCCLVCLSGGCSQLQGLGDSWMHGSRRRRPNETCITLMEGLQRPGEPRRGALFYFIFLKRKNFSLIGERRNQTHPLLRRTFSRLRLQYRQIQAWNHTEDRAQLCMRASKEEDVSLQGFQGLAALTRLLFLRRLLAWCSTHNPDLWRWHTPHSWDKACSLQPGLEPGTGGCPPERVPGDVEQTTRVHERIRSV